MKSIKLVIDKKGFEKLKVLMEEHYLTDCIVNNYSEVDKVNMINKPTILDKIKNLIFFYKNNIKEYEFNFLELSLQELGQKKDIPYCYIISDNNQISSVKEHKLSYKEIEMFQNKEQECVPEM